MGLLGNWFDKKMDAYIESKVPIKQPQATVSDVNYTNLIPEFPFDGEKNPFEMGTPHHIYLDYYSLRARAWEAYLKTDFVQNAIRKYILWVVGSGLKFQSEPVTEVLQSRGIKLSEKELRAFIENTEAQFRLFASTKESTHSQNETLHDLADTVTLNTLLAGDVLCINRYNGNDVDTQMIDGGLIATPIMSEYQDAAIKRGNKIIKGVEINKRGTHIAYYILKNINEYERIVARQSDGTVQAWLMTALKSKESDVRGMSLLTAVLETTAKMDRYKDATLTKAEQNANFVSTIEHEALSDGSNPMVQNLAEAFGKGAPSLPDSVSNGEIQAPKIAKMTGGQVVNMGIGQKLKNHAPDTDGNFKDYFGINIEIVYSTLGIPPEIAKDLFGGSYSGSRAALKSWEYKMNTDRIKKMDRQFYGPIYDFWLNIAVLKNMINAKGYLMALHTGDFMVLAAYRNKRFIGATVPHIDPVKEVSAERLKLGKNMANYPLTSVEQSMENLNTGDVLTMINKRIYENELAKDLLAVADDGDGNGDGGAEGK